MARFFPLNLVAAPGLRLGALLALLLVLGVPSSAAPASTNAAPAQPAPAAAAGKTAAAAKTPPTDDEKRYGKILVPNERFDSPFKLSMPFPGVGEVSIPNRGELETRIKLERLVPLSNQQIRQQLEKWPAYNNMSLADEGTMLIRIQQFRDRRTQIAARKARQLGLLTLTPPQRARFEKEYWDQRLKMDQQLVAQFGPVARADEQKLDADLFREFSNPRSLAQSPKPPAAKAPVLAPSATMMH